MTDARAEGQRALESRLQGAIEKSPLVSGVLAELGLLPAAVVQALVAAGLLAVPEPTGPEPTGPEPTGPEVPVTTIGFAADEHERVLYALLMAYPPGSGFVWGWQLEGDRCLVSVAGAGSGELLEVVRDTVRRPEAIVVSDQVLRESQA